MKANFKKFMPLLYIFFLSLSTTYSIDDSFSNYWNEFRESVTSGNQSGVTALIEFPVKIVRYENDTINEESLNVNDFKKIYGQLFNRSTIDLIKKMNPDNLGHKYINPEKAEREGIPSASYVYFFDIPFQIRDEKKANIFYFIKTETGYTLFISLARPVNSQHLDDLYLSQDRSKK